MQCAGCTADEWLGPIDESKWRLHKPAGRLRGNKTEEDEDDTRDSEGTDMTPDITSSIAVPTIQRGWSTSNLFTERMYEEEVPHCSTARDYRPSPGSEDSQPRRPLPALGINGRHVVAPVAKSKVAATQSVFGEEDIFSSLKPVPGGDLGYLSNPGGSRLSASMPHHGLFSQTVPKSTGGATLSPRRLSRTLQSERYHVKAVRRGSITDKVDPMGHLSEWMTPGNDIYVICLQEIADQRFPSLLHSFLEASNGCNYKTLELAHGKISGRGDGALTNQKATQILIFTRLDIEITKSLSHSFNRLNGSKGAVAFIARVLNQDILFIGCHLTPQSAEARQRDRLIVRKVLSDNLFSGKSLTSSCDHIVWFGDFNCRLAGVKVSTASNLLRCGQIDYLIKFHDEFSFPAFVKDLADEGFCEEKITFRPTYKKKADRGSRMKALHICLRGSTATPPLIDWEYDIEAKGQWYKGGRTRLRCPSWADRILVWSKKPGLLRYVEGSYKAAEDLHPDNPLYKSDHSPVSIELHLFDH